MLSLPNNTKRGQRLPFLALDLLTTHRSSIKFLRFSLSLSLERSRQRRGIRKEYNRRRRSMGQSSSSRRRRSNNYPPTYPPSSTSYLYPPPPPPPTASGYYSHVPPPNHANPYPIPTPPPYNNSYSPQLASGYTNLVRFFDSLMGRSQYSHQYPPYYGTDRDNWRWVSSPPSSSSSTVSNLQPMPQYVEHQKAKTIKNDVNVHKDTIRLEVDEQNPDYYLVSFTFDALVDGSVTIYYFAKEGINCSFSPIYVDMYTPTRVPFQKGSGQKFRQPSGSGIDLGFFELDDLSKPLHGDVFPLIIYAEACPLPLPTNEQVSQSTAAACAQITQAVIEKHNDGSFQVKVIKQILSVDGERYELQEIFGLVNSAEVEAGDDKVDDMGKECVICLSEPRNTAVLPCRHMCMCSECAKALRLQSNKCPICRQPVEKLMEIKVNSADN